MGFKAGNIQGTIALNNTGSGTTNIGSGSNSGTINIGNTSSAAVAIDCGTAGITVGTTANAHASTFGSTNSTSNTTVQSGSGALALTSTNGTWTGNSGTGTLSISTDASATTINIATGAAVKTATFGSLNSTSSTTINAGSGNITIGQNGGTGGVLIGNSTGNTAVTGTLTATGTGITNTLATSGATSAVTVRQTSNTASSIAIFTAEVAGGSAGDAYNLYSIPAVQNWSAGLDNSDSDAYVLASTASLGTGNVMRAQTTGEINYPLQTAFLAYLATTATNKTGTGTNYTIGTDALTEVFDQNNDFNTNGTFTAPVTGRYTLFGGVRVTGTTVATQAIWQIVTSNRTFLILNNRTGSIFDFDLIISSLCDMDSADTATLTISVAGEAADTADIAGAASCQTFFSGYLTC